MTITVADEIRMLNKREKCLSRHVTQHQKEGRLSFKVAELQPYMERLLLVRKNQKTAALRAVPCAQVVTADAKGQEQQVAK